MIIQRQLTFLSGGLALLALLACGRAGVDKPEEPTDEDAIYNIIRYDRPAEFNIDLLDFTVPDTTLMLAGQLQPLFYWRNLQKDSLFIDIQISVPEPGDTLGSVPWADVAVTKFFYGTFEIIALDTTGGGSQRVRLSKNLTVRGDILAVFEKVGFDYNTRRGWILSRISDAAYDGHGPQIRALTFHSSTRPDQVFTPVLSPRPMAAIAEFNPGDSIVLTLSIVNPANYVSVRYPAASGFATRPLEATGPGDYTGGFRLPVKVGFDRFLIDVLKSESVNDTLPYQSTSISVIYRAR